MAEFYDPHGLDFRPDRPIRVSRMTFHQVLMPEILDEEIEHWRMNIMGVVHVPDTNKPGEIVLIPWAQIMEVRQSR